MSFKSQRCGLAEQDILLNVLDMSGFGRSMYMFVDKSPSKYFLKEKGRLFISGVNEVDYGSETAHNWLCMVFPINHRHLYTYLYTALVVL